MKKILTFSFLSAFGFLLALVSSMSFAANPPSFEKDFSSYLTDDKSDAYLWNPENVAGKTISADKDLMTNLKIMFYPS